MKTQHTPGPWGFHLDRLTVYSDSRDCIVASAGGRSPEAYYWPESQDELEANAKLIAAAPDMLEALQEVVELSSNDCSPEERKTWENVFAAIAKATA